MKTLTIQIPDAKTDKLVKEFLSEHGISLSPDPVIESKKSEPGYEAKIERNMVKMMMKATPADLKPVSRDTIMKKMGR